MKLFNYRFVQFDRYLIDGVIRGQIRGLFRVISTLPDEEIPDRRRKSLKLFEDIDDEHPYDNYDIAFLDYIIPTIMNHNAHKTSVAE